MAPTRLHPFVRLLLAAIGLFVAQTLVSLILVGLYMAWTHGQFPGETLASASARTSVAVAKNALLLMLLVYPASIAWLCWCRLRLDKRSLFSLGLRPVRLWPNLTRGMLTGFLSIALLWAILWVSGAFTVQGIAPNAARAGAGVIAPLLGWALAFAAVGFFEEFLFRGYALFNLTDWLGWKWAVVAQGALFAIVHLGNVITAPRAAQMAAVGALPSLFLIGVFFALCFRKTGSLWFPIGFHAAWNFSLGCLFSLPVSGIETFRLLQVTSNTDSWLSGGSFGAEGSFLLLPVLIALVLFIFDGARPSASVGGLGIGHRANARAR